jgi:dimethylsulfoniopropionate demethylase
MNAPGLAITRRIRSTIWSSRLEAYGVKSYTVYNKMLLPTQILGVEEDYQHLRSAVQVWDVACERQVQIAGPDASRFTQLLVVRDLRTFDVGRCGYTPVCDHDGRMINDPIVSRVGEHRYWLSIADSDVLLWADGIARTLGLDVEVSEPDVSPLAVQGPHSDDVMARVFGEAVGEIKFFRFKPLAFRGHEMFVARTGWSAQGGFEIYVDDAELGGLLWDDLMAAGADFDIRPGCPNLIERIEAGLLTYGTDMTRQHTALEAGLEKYCALDAPIEAIGLEALRRQRDAGLTRRMCGFVIDGDRVPLPRDAWPVAVDGGEVGTVTSAVWSPRLESNVALGMMPIELTAVGTEITLIAPDATRTGRVSEVPFPGAVQR